MADLADDDKLPLFARAAGEEQKPDASAQGMPGNSQANAGGLPPSRDYGAIADEFGLDRSIGENAGAKTIKALDALEAFRDGSDRSRAALDKVFAAAHHASSENSEAARKIKGILLDYKTNPVWQPGVMSEKELKGRGAEDPSKRFGNLASISNGTAGAVGSALEAAGHGGPGKAVGALGRGVSAPMGVAAGIDQVRRRGLKDEVKRRKLGNADLPAQLDLQTNRANMSGAQDAMASMLAIRDADDKAAAVTQAQGRIADLKRSNPEAAGVLEKHLGAFVSNPASVPALLREDEIDAFMARGSDFGNYVSIGSAGLDTAALLAGKTAAGPTLAVAAPAIAVSAGGAAALQEWGRRKVEAELARRRLRTGNGTDLGR